MSARIRKIITILVGVLVVALLAVGVFIAIRISQESQNNQAPDSAFAYWCTPASQCPAGWNQEKSNGRCSFAGDVICTQPSSGGGGAACTSCDGWAAIGSTQCNTQLNREYTCSSSCNWIATGRTCGSGTPAPAPTVQCGDNRCEAPENGTSCPADCGTSSGGGGGTGGSTNSCSGPGNAASCTSVGQVVQYGNGGSCICSRTTGTLCGCVPTSGSVCQVNTGTNSGTCNPGSAVGSSCTRLGSNGQTLAGACISSGITNGQLGCTCNVAPIQTPPTPSCSLDSDCQVGNFCNAGTCQPKSPNGTNGCTSNSQCLSGLCQSSFCISAGTGSNSCTQAGANCNNPAGGGTNGFCSNGNCIQKGAVNASCTTDAACQSGLSCLSLRCRQPVDDSNPTQSCISGKWYCYGDSGVPESINGVTGADGQGVICNNGQLNTQWTATDACASFAQNVSTGMSCAGLRRLSGGEALNGQFVGCEGRKNCFCSTLDGSSTVRCLDDVGNDSCGASDIGSDSVTPPTTPPTTPPPSSSVPYCGDAICATGEACERTTANGSSFAACSGATGSAPNGGPVAACYGIELNQPDTTSTCQYCGDGVFTPGREQCDASAPSGNGNNPTQCNSNCTLQQSVSQCIDLVENGVDPVRSGTGNFVQYTLVYQNPSTTNPYPNIRLRVGTSGSPVGRDANATGSVLVSPIPVSGYSFDSTTLRHTYRFRWEAATTGGSAVSDGTYDVRVLLDGSAELSSPTACTETIQVQSTAEQQPLFSIVKQGAPVCVSDGSVQINYTITATNVGPVTGVIDFVRDNIDANIAAAGIVPTNINPTFGAYSSGVINWVGTTEDRTFTAGQSKQYTYRITIPQSQVVNFVATGVLNQVVVQYDTTTTTDNTDSFDVRSTVDCNQITVPVTGIFDDGRLLLFGILLTIAGVLFYRSDIFRRIQRPLIIRK